MWLACDTLWLSSLCGSESGFSYKGGFRFGPCWREDSLYCFLKYKSWLMQYTLFKKQATFLGHWLLLKIMFEAIKKCQIKNKNPFFRNICIRIHCSLNISTVHGWNIKLFAKVFLLSTFRYLHSHSNGFFSACISISSLQRDNLAWNS